MCIRDRFNSNDESFTDGKKVVIGASIDDKKFDVAVGLALHEGSHIKLSDFNLLKNLEVKIKNEKSNNNCFSDLFCFHDFCTR